MSEASDRVKTWRKITKERMVEAMGGKCALCGYCRSHGSLVFHHLDPSVKEFSFNRLRANPRSWSTIVAELKKCVMLCANCHGEVHENLVQVPSDAPSFNPAWEAPETLDSLNTAVCPVCTKPMRPTNQTCSKPCAGSMQKRTDWSKYDLVEMRKTMTMAEIASTVGVHLATVSKRCRKFGI